MNRNLIVQIITQAAQAIKNARGQALAQLLKIAPLNSALVEAIYADFDIDSKCGHLDAPYGEIFYSHFQALVCIAANNYIDAYANYVSLFGSFTRAFGESEGNWMLPVLRQLVVNIRQIATLADHTLMRKGMKTEKLADAEREIKRVFPLCMTDRSQLAVSKKWGSLLIINNLFKIYFHMNNLRLCKNLIAYVKGAGFPDLQRFPVGQVVTYNYFTGRLSMYHGDYKAAREELRFAFNRYGHSQPSLLCATATSLSLSLSPSTLALFLI